MKSILLISTILFVTIIFGQSNSTSFKQTSFKFGFHDVLRGNPTFYCERRINEGISFEGSLGLTFNDYLAIHEWEGTQYVYMDNLTNTRFSGGIQLNIYPLKKHPQTYFAMEFRKRRYYSANKENLLETGYWIGSKRNETNFKSKIGSKWQMNDRMFLEYSFGLTYLSSHDNYEFLIGNPGELYFISGNETVTKWFPSVELKFGINKKSRN